jgi:hypothetical protein
MGFNFNIFEMTTSSPYLERMENPTLLWQLWQNKLGRWHHN